MKKSTWIPIVFAAALAAASVALFGWPGPARQFLVAQKDWIRSLAAAVAVVSAATALVLGLRRYLGGLEAAAEKPPATGAEPGLEASPKAAVAASPPEVTEHRVPKDPMPASSSVVAPAVPPPAPPAIQAGERGVAIGGSAADTVVSTGDGNIIAESVQIFAAGEPSAAFGGGGMASAAPAIQAGERGSTPGDRALELFISYAHEDEALRAEIDQHLSLLVREGWIRPWHDREIAAGEEWRGQIDARLEAADLILLLVSPAFLASDYCFDVESSRALERHASGEARVIPVIVCPCDWSTAPFAELQALPRDGKSVTTWDNQDEAWLDVARGLRAASAGSGRSGSTVRNRRRS